MQLVKLQTPEDKSQQNIVEYSPQWPWRELHPPLIRKDQPEAPVAFSIPVLETYTPIYYLRQVV